MSQYWQESAGLQTWNLFKKWLKHKCFSVNVVNFLRAAFSIEHIWWLLLIKSEEKFFKWKKKMKAFHLNSTRIFVNSTISHPFFLTFFKNFLSIDPCLFIFLCVHFVKTEKYILYHLLVYSEQGIESCSVKQLLGKI